MIEFIKRFKKKKKIKCFKVNLQIKEKLKLEYNHQSELFLLLYSNF